MPSPSRKKGYFLPWSVGELVDQLSYSNLLSRNVPALRYEHAWPFVAQYLRRGGWLFNSVETAAVVIRDRRGFPRLVSFFGEETPAAYVALARAFGHALIIENVPEAMGYELCQLAGWSYIEEIASLDERPESTYPQVSVDLSRIGTEREVSSWRAPADLQLPGVNWRFQRDARQGLRNLVHLGGSLVRWNPSYLPAALDCARLNAKWHSQRVSRHGDSLEGGAASLFEPVEFVLRGFANRLGGFVALTGERIVGFALTFPVGDQHIGIYANGSVPDVPYVMDLLFAACVADLIPSSASALLLGGSETYGLYHFKKKIGAIRESQMRTLRFWPEKQ